MGSSKVQTIQDPLAQQKTAAANLGLQNYQTASSAVPSLQSFYNQNFGNTSGSGVNPLLSAVSSSVLGDISGQGGPYTSLLQNTLGTFDAGQEQAQQGLNQQIQAQGFGGSGAGMAVLGDQGANAAQQRALLASQLGVNELNTANQLGLQQFNIGQQLGFSDPMAALSAIQSLASPPNFENVDNTLYQQPSTFSQIAPILGQLGGAALSGGMNLMGSNAIAGALGGLGGGGTSPMTTSLYGPLAPQTGGTLQNGTASIQNLMQQLGIQ